MGSFLGFYLIRDVAQGVGVAQAVRNLEFARVMAACLLMDLLGALGRGDDD